MSCSCPTDHARPALGRRAVLAGGLAAGATTLLPGFVTAAGARTRDFGYPPPSQEVTVRPIMFPVLADPNLGKATWTDTWMAPRSGGRSHEGQDLMGPKMLKLLACVTGTVVELRHGSSGNSLYLKGDDGWYYCYLHINNDDPGTDNGANRFEYAFAPGLKNGSRVRKGDLVAFMGDSGNAEASGSHLHFEIRKPAASVWQAAAINPRYSLERAEAARLGGSVDVTPFPDTVAFVVQQSFDWLGGLPSWTWLATYVNRIDAGVITPDAFIEHLINGWTVVDRINPVIRMYQAYFGGIPVASGINYWAAKAHGGMDHPTISEQLVGSAKFAKMWGPLSNADFARRIYLNMYGFEPRPGEHANWTAELDGGKPRHLLVRQKVESLSYRSRTANRVRVLSVYASMLRYSPPQANLDAWIARDRASATGLQDLIRAARLGPQYAARF